MKNGKGVTLIIRFGFVVIFGLTIQLYGQFFSLTVSIFSAFWIRLNSPAPNVLKFTRHATK